jgi:histidine phosphotransfer protein HptB
MKCKMRNEWRAGGNASLRWQGQGGRGVLWPKRGVGVMIDWERVQELRSEIGPDSFMEVVDMFLEEADGVAARLASGVADTALEAELHFLKGSALNLGLDQLAALCQAGERAAAKGDAGTVDRAAVMQAYAASKSAFLDGLDTATAA